ncbi:alpha/beta hydrolase [Maribacter hydrothermalis]|uniref:Esterase n=1 Tax=Maribacter hydrothermalis TaxID=1836467 RepID=A0A1B7ZCR7_9FLAO|nr:alpha/beta hydrolase [Maribacter hydrothermalis]APQ18537.1 esterase [Maribacter hydrothermalis]OBR40908.1 esterase [Maribacter hydrothermalis]
MENQIKNISYKSTNTYDTLNELNRDTKRVWVVFHGIGFLSRFFLNYFTELPKNENYIIAPQAPSKYYLKNEYKHVGASWLTKENTIQETVNLFNYLDAVLKNENLPDHCKIVFFGFSQGVSIALRYLAYSKLECAKLILYAGGLPKELKKSDFSFLSDRTEIISILGNQDEYLTPDRLVDESKKLKMLFGNKVRQIRFEGGHEVKKEIINQL